MRQRLGLLVPMALAAASFGVGCASDPSPTTDHELSGFVTNETTTDPVSGASVTFSSDTLYTTSATTDSDGYYEMVIQTDSNFGQVRAEKAGYFVNEMTVYFDSDARRVDFTLRPE